MKNKRSQIKLIIGLILIISSLFLFLTFNSYWEHGIADQNENAENIQNTLGTIGAFVSKFSIELFGVSTYLFLSILFLIGLKTTFYLKSINLLKIILQHLFLILWVSLLFSILPEKTPSLSGKIGITLSEKITLSTGETGLILLLITSFLIFIIITFNVSKKHILKLQMITHSILFSLKKKITSKDIIKNKSIDTHLNKTQAEKKNKTIKKHETNIKTQNTEKNDLIVQIAEEENILTHNKTQTNSTEENKKAYIFPNLDLLKKYEKNTISIDEQELETNKKLIEDTLKDFKIDVTVKRATVGPTITLYEIIPDEGVRIAKIKNLENDIALRIKAVGVRIIAPLPGRGTVGIEVPNQKPTIVSMKQVIESEKFQNANLELPIAIGKTISNETFVMDLTKMPHLLIAGATGQGKSVGLNAILCSILYKKHPNEVKFILVDPKKVELTLYNKIEQHFLAKLPNNIDPIITDTKNVITTLKSLCTEMDNRYNLLKKAEVRNIQEYNLKYKKQELNNQEGHQFLPYLVLVIDEFADLIMTAGKEIEIPISRLAQLSRAIGIHLIIATQRPTTNIITGTIKANFPTRIAFRVIQGIDSKTILDTVGANQLIGRGDMLISTGSNLLRIQCAFIDTPEVEALTNFIKLQEYQSKPFELPNKSNNNINSINIEPTNDERDPLFKEAALLIVINQQGSTSMIQRKLKLGYNRAGRIIDQLEDAGILGPLEGSKGRKVLIQTEEELNHMI